MRPYKFHLRQEHSEDDSDRSMQFCQEMDLLIVIIDVIGVMEIHIRKSSMFGLG